MIDSDNIKKNSTRTSARSKPYLVAAMLMYTVTFGVLGHTQAASTPAALPTAGSAVKAGDLIGWQVNKAITLTGLSGTSGAPASAGSASTAPNAADTAAAALAISNAALALVNSPGPPAPGAAPDAVAKYKAAYGAYQAAQSQLDTAKKAMTKDGPAATQSGTIAAAGSYLDEARKSLQQAEDAKSAAKPADAAHAEAALAQADALFNAAASAFQTLATSAAATAPADTAANAAAASAAAGTVCFPNRALFNVTSIVAASKNSSAAGTVVSNTQLISGHFPSNPGIFHHFFNVNRNMPLSATPCGTASTPAQPDKTYDFTSDQLDKQDFYREGFTWGGLVIPYKYYFKDKSIKSNSSIVAFVGYEGWFPGVSLAAVAAAGAGTTQSPSATTSTPSSTTAGTPTTSPSATSTATTVTYTAAVGVIATFGGVVKAGLMFGRDYQGNASAFPYENKTWMALSIGAGF